MPPTMANICDFNAFHNGLYLMRINTCVRTQAYNDMVLRGLERPFIRTFHTEAMYRYTNNGSLFIAIDTHIMQKHLVLTK